MSNKIFNTSKLTKKNGHHHGNTSIELLSSKYFEVPQFFSSCGAPCLALFSPTSPKRKQERPIHAFFTLSSKSNLLLITPKNVTFLFFSWFAPYFIRLNTNKKKVFQEKQKKVPHLISRGKHQHGRGRYKFQLQYISSNKPVLL